MLHLSRTDQTSRLISMGLDPDNHQPPLCQSRSAKIGSLPTCVPAVRPHWNSDQSVTRCVAAPPS
ncbi:hypothetical protein K227x_38790 [Rubripirellula lacrimiformis]|uniref:Uncharacterized protein n=1 Tax=Rubripirellula lacrimiformis TaxID=1930273 RepID=A0A517NEB4_9BACT|nr:hypothetical protein K227x_38790 [Rubripirellula lacrimiformis]